MSSTTTTLDPRRLPIGRGWDWVMEGFQLFGQAPGTWVLMMLLYLVGAIALAFIPGASLLMSLFSYVFTGGLMLGCASLESGQGLRIEHLFAGFKAPHLGNLVLLGALYLALTFVIIFVCIVIGVTVVGISFHGMPDPKTMTPEQALPIVLMALIIIAALIPLMMGVWLAPPLIVLRGIGPVEAFKLSFRACLINFLPLLWYGVIVLVISIIAMVPLFLGLLVVLPATSCALYRIYCDVFPQPPPMPETAPPPLQ